MSRSLGRGGREQGGGMFVPGGADSSPHTCRPGRAARLLTSRCRTAGCSHCTAALPTGGSSAVTSHARPAPASGRGPQAKPQHTPPGCIPFP